MRNPYQARRGQNSHAQSKKNEDMLDNSLERYKYFIKNIVLSRQVWGLYQDGWAIGATSQGRHVLPLWADKSFAQLCQTQNWVNHAPTAISLESFIFKMLPYAVEEKILLSVMMTPEGKSVFLEPDKILLDLKNFLYEVYSVQPEFFKQYPDVPLPRQIRINA